MPDKMDLYRALSILGLDGNPDFNKIRKRYRDLVFKYHPDKSGSNRSAEKFRAVVEAYGFLLENYMTNGFSGGSIFERVKYDKKLMCLSEKELYFRLVYSKSVDVKRVAAIALSLKGRSSKGYLLSALSDESTSVCNTILNLLYEMFTAKDFLIYLRGFKKIRFFKLKVKAFLRVMFLLFRKLVSSPAIFKNPILKKA